MAKTIDRIKERNIELLDYYVKLHKKNPRLKYFVPLAEIYRSLNLLDEAVETLQEGLKWHPNYFIARSLLSQTYFQMGKFLQASLEAKHVLNVDPQNLMALRISIGSNEKLGEKGFAMESLKKLLKLVPDDKGALELLPKFLQAPLFSPGRIEDFEIRKLTPPKTPKTKHKHLAFLQGLLKTIQNKTPDA